VVMLSLGELELIYHKARLLSSHTNQLEDTFSKLTASENKKRVLYRSELGGRLPWEVRGIDASAEMVELEMRKTNKTGEAVDDLPEITMADVQGRSLRMHVSLH